MKMLLILLVMVLLGYASVNALASTSAFIDLDETWRGDGYVNAVDFNDRLSSVHVVLRVSKNADIILKGNRNTIINAKWSGDPKRRVYFDITKAFNDPYARGKGSMVIDRGKLERLSLDGSARNGKFSVSFSGTGQTISPPIFPPEISSFSGLDETRSGSGVLKREGRYPDPLSKVRVKLDRNGRAEFKFEGRDQYVLNGKWSETSGRSFRISIDRAFGDYGATGSGRVYLDTRSLLDRIELEGRSKGDKYNITFKVGVVADIGLTEFSDNAYGYGTMRLNGDKFDDLRMAEVELDRRGGLRIRTEGKRPQVITGRWSGGPERVSLRIDKISSITGADGTGTLYIRRDRIDRFDIQGRFREGKYSISFDAK